MAVNRKQPRVLENKAFVFQFFGDICGGIFRHCLRSNRLFLFVLALIKSQFGERKEQNRSGFRGGGEDVADSPFLLNVRLPRQSKDPAFGTILRHPLQADIPFKNFVKGSLAPM